MALFDLKAVIDPLAQEVREFGTTLIERLSLINDEQEETNRLLRSLVQMNATSTGSVKTRILKEALGE